MRVVFVHGACVRDGAWWWGPSAAALDRHGVSSHCPALPSCGESAGPVSATGPGLAEDAAAVRELLVAGGDEPTVVVGHSYGGIVTAQAAAGVDAVVHLLLISSYLPEPGESLASFGPPEPAPFLEVDPDRGTFTVSGDALAATFLQDCTREVQAQARAHRADQSVSVIEAPVRVAAWQQIPSTYLVCGEDRGTPAERQRAFAERAGQVREIAAGHHPFISQPDLVCALIRELAPD